MSTYLVIQRQTLENNKDSAVATKFLAEDDGVQYGSAAARLKLVQ